MRQTFIACKTRNTAKRHCPWAAVIAKADNGYWCFESVMDYRIWKHQK